MGRELDERTREVTELIAGIDKQFRTMQSKEAGIISRFLCFSYQRRGVNCDEETKVDYSSTAT